MPSSGGPDSCAKNGTAKTTGVGLLKQPFAATARSSSGAATMDSPQVPSAGWDEEAERQAIQDEGCAKVPSYVSVTPPESFVSRYVAYARQRTDAPPEAHELMAVGILSALAGPKPRVPLATSIKGLSLVLWALYIVNSTVGRK